MPAPLVARELTHSIIGAFYFVYNELDFGHLEGIYVRALERELIARGHRVSREYGVRVNYRGDEVGFERLDMVVDDTVVVEAKSTEFLSPLATRQLRAYLRATSLEVGLVLHFGPRPNFVRVYSQNRLVLPHKDPEASGPSV